MPYGGTEISRELGSFSTVTAAVQMGSWMIYKYKSLQVDGNILSYKAGALGDKGAVPRASESPNKSLVALTNDNCDTSCSNNSAPSHAQPL